MSFRTTAILLVLLAVVGGYAYFYGRKTPPATQEKPPFVYSVDLDNIVRMQVTHGNHQVEIKWDDSGQKWVFTDPSIGDADQSRVNSVRFLLTGPGAKRAPFQGDISDLSQFGLDNPQLIATVELKDASLQ